MMAAIQSNRAALSAPDRRRFYRADIEVDGRIMDERGVEQDCLTADVSPGGARLRTPRPPLEGESLVLYLGPLGRVPAKVSRIEPEGAFGVQFQVSGHKREKLAEQLTWMMNKGLFAHEERRATRHDGAGSLPVILEDGTALVCEVRDFSLVGCSVRTDRPRPPVGAWVRVGQTYGRVARYLHDGFALDFQTRASHAAL
ncbi:MAG: PilZ domain-containing protein [Alphaproteobacteria bacterium]